MQNYEKKRKKLWPNEVIKMPKKASEKDVREHHVDFVNLPLSKNHFNK